MARNFKHINDADFARKRGCVIPIREDRSSDVLDIRDLVASALQAFCEQARAMKAEIR